MTRDEKLNSLLEDIGKKQAELEKARSDYAFAGINSTDDPEPKAGDVETIRAAIESWATLCRCDSCEIMQREALAALSRLSAPIDVQAKAEAVVDLFADNYAPLNAMQKQDLSRLIVEQFSRKG